MRIVSLLLLAAAIAAAQPDYAGPRPEKKDLPYIKHAASLIPTEATTATEGKGPKKDDILYVIKGAASTAKTPLASPIFLFESDKLAPEALELYKLEVKGNQRQIVASPKKPMESIHIDVEKITGSLYKIEVSISLEPGEYSLSPKGSNDVFCFQVF